MWVRIFTHPHACAPGKMVNMGLVCLMKLTRKRKLISTLFSPGHFDHWKLRQAACTLSDHGTSSVSNEINQKIKVDQNTWFCFRFSPAHFDHQKLRQDLKSLLLGLYYCILSLTCLLTLTRTLTQSQTLTKTRTLTWTQEWTWSLTTS